MRVYSVYYRSNGQIDVEVSTENSVYRVYKNVNPATVGKLANVLQRRSDTFTSIHYNGWIVNVIGK